MQTAEPYPGSTDPAAAGNGSLMRLAPAPLAFAATRSEAIAGPARVPRTTHAARGVRRRLPVLRRAAGRRARGPVEGRISCPEISGLAPKVAEIAGGSFKRKEPPQIRGSAPAEHTTAASRPAVANSAMTSSIGGPNHGSAVRPALCHPIW